MYHFKGNEAAKPAESKRNAEQSLRRVVLKNSVLTNAKKIIHFQENRQNQFVAPRAVDTTDTAKTTRISSLVVNKWQVPVTGSQIVPVIPKNNKSNRPHSSSTKHTGDPMIKNININGRVIPMKVLKIIPANKENSIQQASSSDNAQESVTHNRPPNLDEQSDLREQVKRINDQNAQILARINRSKSFSCRLRYMKDVDEFEDKIDTNTKRNYLANYLRKRIKNKFNVVMEIIELMFTEELISQFNPNGLRGKRSFKKLHLDSVIRVLSGLGKAYYVELARCIHTITERYRRRQLKNH